jgi:hypothetical protein
MIIFEGFKSSISGRNRSNARRAMELTAITAKKTYHPRLKKNSAQK